jgi:hypothetical protein
MNSRRRVNTTVRHFHMRFNRLHVLAFLLLFVGCVRPPIITPSSQAEADKAIDHEQARRLSDSIADDIQKDNRARLFNSMEKAFHDYYDNGAYSSLIDRMFAAYGKPLDVEFKMDELGRKTGSGGYDKPMRKFWYATRTSKYEKGIVFLTVEIVPDEGHLASSGVAMVTFPVGVPPSLK